MLGLEVAATLELLDLGDLLDEVAALLEGRANNWVVLLLLLCNDHFTGARFVL